MDAKNTEMKDRTRERFIRARALAFLNRGRTAGIPDRYLRINKEMFTAMLFEDYHGDSMKNVVSLIYDSPNDLFKIPYIIIDGGDSLARRRAGFALLFRLIACDKFGLYKEAVDLAHKFRTPLAIDSKGRNDLIEDLKVQDILFISEIYPKLFPVNFDTGTFFDEVLVARENTLRPTILSFFDAVGDSSKFTVDCGKCIHELSQKLHPVASNKSINPSNDVLRIRVKKQDVTK